MNNSTNCHTVADYFLLQVDAASGDAISHLKLQKLVYQAQAWSLALRGRPLFEEPIEAWAHGPVVPELHDRFEHLGWQSIDPLELTTDPLATLSDDDAELLAQVWTKYGGLSGSRLRALTHGEIPWKKAYGQRPPGERCDEVITHDAMRKFYGAKVERNANDPSPRTAERA